MLLVVGANGQLGSELKNILQDKAVYVDKDELDITDENKVKNFLQANSFECVINCAAYTAVDKAEDEPEIAKKINVTGVKNLAKYAQTLVHISTDYVFDGKAYMPYKEDDQTNPQSVYGKTKLEGEILALENAKTAIIIRTAWLYSIYGNNFVKTMQKLGAQKEEINVIFDQVGTPTHAKDLANAIVQIIPQIKEGTKQIYHFSNEGVCSWYDFAKQIMCLSDLNCKVNPIETFEYPTKAVRPNYSVLNKAKIKKDFNIKIAHWTDALAEFIELQNSGNA